jgi:HD-GYP domain-containing protein (c-di-GMP phosphodiesterase class II)
MKQNSRRYVVLVFAQGACLALGLWFEYRLITFGKWFESTSCAPAESHRLPEAERSASVIEAVSGVSHSVPWSARIVSLAWIAALQGGVAWLVLSRAQEAAQRQKTKAESVSMQRYNDLLRTRDALIFGLAKLAESRDPDTGNHLERIAIYSTRLASALHHNSPYHKQISPQFVQLIGISSSLHDIGKVGIADSILMKPGRFVEEERLVMQMHVAIGGKCVQDIETRLGQSNFLQMAREIAIFHHERWDGEGYPEGLAGGEIPLAARIVAVADVYDALSTRRIYKDAIGHRQCVEMIRHEAGRHFDPVVVEAFLTIEKEFEATVQRCGAELGESAAALSTSSVSVALAQGDRMDEDLTLAMELLKEWMAENPDAERVLSKRETGFAAGIDAGDTCKSEDAARTKNESNVDKERLLTGS